MQRNKFTLHGREAYTTVPNMYRFLPEYEGSTLESTPERRRREGADEQSTPEYERYGTDLSRAVRFTC